MVSSSRATSSEDPPTLKRARCSEEAGEGLWGWAGRLSPEPLSSVGSSLSSGSESKPKAGMSYSGSSYLSFSGESWLSLVLAGASSASLGLLGGAGGGTLGRVSVLVRRLRLGFLRLSMYDAGAQPSFSPIDLPQEHLTREGYSFLPQTALLHPKTGQSTAQGLVQEKALYKHEAGIQETGQKEERIWDEVLGGLCLSLAGCVSLGKSLPLSGTMDGLHPVALRHLSAALAALMCSLGG